MDTKTKLRNIIYFCFGSYSLLVAFGLLGSKFTCLESVDNSEYFETNHELFQATKN